MSARRRLYEKMDLESDSTTFACKKEPTVAGGSSDIKERGEKFNLFLVLALLGKPTPYYRSQESLRQTQGGRK